MIPVKTSAGQSIFVFVATMLASQLAFAQDAAGFLQAMKPYAKAGVAYDSNLYRYSDKDMEIGEVVVDGVVVDAPKAVRSLSDTIYTVGAGIESELIASQQKFIIKGDVYRNMYDDFSDEDYTGANANLTWKWKFAERWDGDLGYEYDRDRQDYANQSVGRNPDAIRIKIQNIRTRQSVVGKANYLLTREWSLFAKTKVTDISFDERKDDLNNERDDLDNERKKITVGGDYTTRIGNRIGVDADFVKGDYDNNSGLDYEEFNLGPTGNWKISEKTRLRGKIDYSSRDSSLEEDFDGITWRITMVRNPGSDNNSEAAIYREISTLNDDISNYAVVDGVSFAPNFKLGGKTNLSVLGQYEIRDFKGTDPDDTPVIGEKRRKDKVATLSAGVDWEATRAITLSALYTYEDRSSNRALEEYDYNLIELRIHGGF